MAATGRKSYMKLGMRLGKNLEQRSENEDLNLTYLLCWPTCFSGRLGCQVSRECLLELGVEITGCMEKKVREDLCDLMWMGAERMGGTGDLSK